MKGIVARLARMFSRPWLWAAAFGLLIWFVLPWMVVTVDDDFGYLRSVVETFRRGRPWTYDWLTPWAASLTALAGFLFKISGSFKFAIQTSLMIAAALAWLGLTSFLTSKGVSRLKSCVIAFLILGSPSVVFMLLMFTSVSLYMGCLWLCIWLSSREKWGWFFVAWFAGLAARQSAVTWLALPAWAVLETWWKTGEWPWRERKAWPPALVIISGGLALLFLKLVMNPTYGQAVVAAATKGFHGVSLALGLLILIAGAGCSCFAVCLADREQLRRGLLSLRSPLRCGLVLVAGLLGFIGARWFADHIVCTHSTYGDPLASWWFALVGIVAGAGLVFRPVVPHGGMIIAGLGAAALVSLYGGVFDYYFIDGFFWGFAAAVVPVQRRTSETASSSFRLASAAGIAVVVALVVWNCRSLVRHKYEMDRVAALNVLYEKALREKKIQPHEIGLAPFGFVGWRMEPYFHANQGRESGDLGGFLFCVDGWDGSHGMASVIQMPKAISRLHAWLPSHNNALLGHSKEAVSIAKLRVPLLWFYKATIELRKMPGPVPREGKVTVNYGAYQDHPFPLNDAEWRDLIRGKS